MQEQPKYLRSFGRIKSRKLRASSAAAIEEVLPKYLTSEGKNLPDQYKEKWLEIGFGGGEHLIHQAKNNPEVGFVGCEPFINGMAKLLKSLDDNNLTNIRIWDNDFRILSETIPDNYFDKAFILFPDPWPKKKQNKRRLIQGPLLEILARIMKKGSILRIATDHEGYAAWIIKHLLDDKNFKWTAESAKDWKTQPADHIITKYQQKALAGDKPVFLEFVRK